MFRHGLSRVPVHSLPPLHCSWFYDTRLYWGECSSWPCDVPVSYGERFIYCLVLGFYVQVGAGAGGWAGWAVGRGQPACAAMQARHSAMLHLPLSFPGPPHLTRLPCPCHPVRQAVPMLFLWETKRKDRLEVFAHHVATIILIAYSYYLKCGRGRGLREGHGQPRVACKRRRAWL